MFLIKYDCWDKRNAPLRQSQEQIDADSPQVALALFAERMSKKLERECVKKYRFRSMEYISTIYC